MNVGAGCTLRSGIDERTFLPMSGKHNDKDSPPEHEGDFKQLDKDSRGALKMLLRPVSGPIFLGRVLGALSALVSIAPFILLTELGRLLLSGSSSTEQASNEATTHEVRELVTWLIIAFSIQLFLYFVALVITHLADEKLKSIIRNRIVAAVSRAPLSWFNDRSSGEVRKTIQDDSKTLHTLVAHAPVDTTVAMISPTVLAIYAFIIDWHLGLLSIAMLPVFIGLQATMMASMGPKTAEMNERLQEVSARAVEFVEGIEVVKNFGIVGKAHSAYANAAKNFSKFYWQWCGPLITGSALSMAAVSVPVLMFINVGGGALMVAAGWVNVPEVLVCSLISLMIPQALVVILNMAWSYQHAGAAALHIVEVTFTPQLSTADPDTASETGKILSPVSSDEVEFIDVSYSYTTENGPVSALENINITLRPGTITALVGPSGSGKSTLATMVARFQDPDSGQVLIGGCDVRALRTDELYRQVSFVLQDAQLVRASIRDNIALARPDASDDEVETAARAAVIWEDIELLEQGLDTVIGEDTELSGGQRQRISIARAILTDAPILILDEATAATDPDCQTEIQTALSHLVQSKTVLVIAHSAAAIRGVDNVLVLGGGRIDAAGTPAELDASNNHYWYQLRKADINA